MFVTVGVSGVIGFDVAFVHGVLLPLVCILLLLSVGEGGVVAVINIVTYVVVVMVLFVGYCIVLSMC